MFARSIQPIATLSLIPILSFDAPLASLLRNIRQPLINEIINGASVRILIVDLYSQAGKVMQQNSDKPHMMESDFVLALDFIRDMRRDIEARNSSGSISVKFISWIPSCSLFIIKYSKDEGIMKVTVHPPSFRLSAGQRRHLIFYSQNRKHDFDYFSDQFQFSWEKEARDMPSRPIKEIS